MTWIDEFGEEREFRSGAQVFRDNDDNEEYLAREFPGYIPEAPPSRPRASTPRAWQAGKRHRLGARAISLVPVMDFPKATTASRPPAVVVPDGLPTAVSLVPGQTMTLRGCLYREPCSAAQRKALAAGRDVAFGRDWLEATFPGATQHPEFPESWDVAEVWVLRGDSAMEPAS